MNTAKTKNPSYPRPSARIRAIRVLFLSAPPDPAYLAHAGVRSGNGSPVAWA